MIGGDLGYTRDCTAFVAAWESPEGPIVLEEPVILEPPGDGTSISIEDMVAAATSSPSVAGLRVRLR